MLWNRQDYIDLLTCKNSDRQMLVELFGLLVGLEDEWRVQGASNSEIDLTDFCFDRVEIAPLNINTGLWENNAPLIIEDTDEFTIMKDSLGRTMKLFKGSATLPLPLDYPVNDIESWLRIKPRYEFREERIEWNSIDAAKTAQNSGALVCASIEGAFDLPRQLMGEEMCCLAYYDQPELMRDIISTITDMSVKVLDRVSDRITIDHLSVHEDMAGKCQPLVGPNIINDFYKPYYRAVWDMLRSKGTKIFCQDSDGNMNPVIDAFIECGVNVFLPCEPAASMDIVELRKRYGNKISFKGGIDKHVLRQSKENILKELEYKLQPLMQSGGVVFGIDHRIPNGTPVENYRYYVKTAREMLGLPPIEQAQKGWARMGF